MSGTKGSISCTDLLARFARRHPPFRFLPASALSQHIAPLPPNPTPQDVAYPAGPITLDVDATDTARHIFRVHEVVPLAGGQTVTLLYPRWLPGNHSPTGPDLPDGGLEECAPMGSASRTWAARHGGILLRVSYRLFPRA